MVDGETQIYGVSLCGEAGWERTGMGSPRFIPQLYKLPDEQGEARRSDTAPQFHAVLAIRDLLCADQLALIEYAPGQPGPRIVESSMNGDGRHLPPFCASKPPSHPRMLKQRFASCASGLRYGSKLQYDCVGGEGLCAQASSSFHVRN